MEEVLQRKMWPFRAACCSDVLSKCNMDLAERLVRWHVARTELRNSDVKFRTGDLLSPHHINDLEAFSIIMELRRRSRSTKHLNCIYLLLVDPQVAIGVFTKTRSSSRLFQGAEPGPRARQQTRPGRAAARPWSSRASAGRRGSRSPPTP